MDNAQHFYEFMVGSLLTAESLLLAVFGSLLSIYATYKSTQGEGNAAPIVKTVAITSKILIALTCLIAIAALCCLGALYDSGNKISGALLLVLALIVVGLVAPAVFIVLKMK